MSNAGRFREIAKAALKVEAESRNEFVNAACGPDHELAQQVWQEIERLEDVTSSSSGREDDSDDFSLDMADASEPELTVSSGGDGEPTAPPIGYREELVIAEKYKLVQRIGEGGMGEVWLANQTEPVRRKVAIKLIKAGADSQQVVARFEAERQALAVMDHPHIARILDGGSFQGAPYFVMEWVRGAPITQYCDQHRLDVRQRLHLFVSVCDAIQHAHQKGIIHRDIKPSNILVAISDNRPVPKVIDFGVAKATGLPLTDKTLNTMVGAVVGTPQYMSPEQADVNLQDIDTRSDVYSLGIVLYELLTGRTPFDAKKLGRAAIMEILRIIREDDPPTPSSKLSTDQGLPNISQRRNTEPMRLMRMMRGELDWIVMKALEKDRARRYESASSFARDVTRYLSGEQVLAAPPSRWYRLRKFVRMHRTAVATIGLVFLSLIGGIAGISVGLWNAETQRKRADQARHMEAIQREQAEAATQQALAALQSFTDDFVERQFATRAILTANDRALLNKALAQWEEFAKIQGTSQQASLIRAEGEYRVAKLRQLLGEAGAEQGYLEAIRLLQELIAGDPNNAKFRQQIGDAQTALGKLLLSQQRPAEALASIEEASQHLQRGCELKSGDASMTQSAASAWSALAVVQRALGNLDQARRSYEEAIRLQQWVIGADPLNGMPRQLLATMYNNRGNLSMQEIDINAANQFYRQGLELREQLVAECPDDPQYVSGLADSHYGLGDLAQRYANTQLATTHYDKARQLYQQLVRQFPNIPDYANVLAKLHRNLAVMLDRMSEFEKSLTEIRSGVAVRERLAADYPDWTQFRFELAYDRTFFGKKLAQNNQLEEAQEVLDQALTILEEFCSTRPDEEQFHRELANCLRELGMLSMQQGNQAKADEYLNRSIDVLNHLVGKSQASPQIWHDISEAYFSFGKAYASFKELEKARFEFDRADEVLAQLIADHPQVLSFVQTRRDVASTVGVLFEAHNQWQQALERYVTACNMAARLVELDPDVEHHHMEVCGLFNRRALALSHLGDREGAMQCFDESNRLVELMLEKFPDHLEVRVLRAGNAVNYHDLIQNLVTVEERETMLSKAIQELEELANLPDPPRSLLSFLHNALLRRAMLLEQQQRHLDSADDWHRLAQLPNAEDRVMYLSKTAQGLARAGQIDRALEIAQQLKDVKQPQTIFARVRIFALAYGHSADDVHAQQSLSALRELIALGFNDTNRLRRDPDLQSMQEHPDFLQLLDEM